MRILGRGALKAKVTFDVPYLHIVLAKRGDFLVLLVEFIRVNSVNLVTADKMFAKLN